MFAARNPLKRSLLLGGLRVLCVKKNLQPRRAMSSYVTKRSRLFSSLFLQEDENISPILPISSALSKKEHFGNYPRINRLRTLLQNTGGGTAPATHSAQSLPFFPTASKHPTHTNARKPNPLIGLPHGSLDTQGVGMFLRCGTGILACLQSAVAQASACARSRPPVQRHRPIHRMHHRRTSPPRL
jgi:hypothetical protein